MPLDPEQLKIKDYDEKVAACSATGAQAASALLRSKLADPLLQLLAHSGREGFQPAGGDTQMRLLRALAESAQQWERGGLTATAIIQGPWDVGHYAATCCLDPVIQWYSPAADPTSGASEGHGGGGAARYAMEAINEQLKQLNTEVKDMGNELKEVVKNLRNNPNDTILLDERERLVQALARLEDRRMNLEAALQGSNQQPGGSEAAACRELYADMPADVPLAGVTILTLELGPEHSELTGHGPGLYSVLKMPLYASSLAKLPAAPPGAVLTGAQRMVAAVEWIHSKGYIHMDIKADNVFVDAEGRHMLAVMVVIELVRYFRCTIRDWKEGWTELLVEGGCAPYAKLKAAGDKAPVCVSDLELGGRVVMWYTPLGGSGGGGARGSVAANDSGCWSFPARPT
ncbi:hypothetical protein GPECTOR_74g707 [Gonium pectorale]|uniref:Protein kinase domain-containing protein n=1 Tax=Gonium pectorale TaxID=33097 RepID=A0A150G2P5_GONPE|nr:hypothetical protein GPECTOR_74g707 [Gonium pectorale]|eukprot:KXZ44093.1 hypothetical protein GPECTOR_74g707 [Gonium pectorale]